MIAATLYAGGVLQNDIRVPFVDLRTVNLPLRDDLLDAIGDLLERGSFVAGRDIEEFEEAFAELAIFGDRAEPLKAVARYLIERTN